jgi:crossover junction endodeoxyribonuclease RuvC
LEVQGKNLEPVYCNCIITSKKNSLDKRLKIIYSSISEAIKEYKPECLAIEKIFFSVNAKTAIKVGHARGVALLAASMYDLSVFEYTPLEIKQAIVGYGRATKKQIKFMLKNILNVKDDFFPSRDDAWDAMAVCICHANSYRFKKKTEWMINDS